MKTAKEAVMSAAVSLPQPFSLAELAEAAWKLKPELFSIPGSRQWPSDNTLKTLLYGQKGLLKAGLLQKSQVEKGRFEISKPGLMKTVETLPLPPGEPEPPTDPDSPSAEEMNLWKRYFANMAIATYLKRLGIKPCAESRQKARGKFNSLWPY